MEKGYIAWNESNCGSEFFGAFRSKKRAERELRRVVRERFGRCPRDLVDLVEEPFANGGDDSYKVTYFNNEKGE